MLGIFGYLLFALLAVGGESSVHQAYLQQHKQEINLSAEDEFSLFDSAFYQNQIFILAEVHGFAAPQELDYRLLKHLNQQTGLRYYLAEVDYSQAHFLNQYLQTGDEPLLSYVFQTWVKMNAQWGNKNYYNKLKKIYQLNQQLPEERRISIVGVDKIQDIAVTNQFLREIIGKPTYAILNPNGFDTLHTYLETDTISLQQYGLFSQSLLSSIQQDSTFSSLPDTEKFDLLHVLRNISYFAQPSPRDSIMYINLQAVVKEKHLEHEKMYGLWGYGHTLPSTFNGRKSFVHFLKENIHFSGKVLAMNTFAIDSENMIPARSMPEWLTKTEIPDKKLSYISTTWVNSNGPLAFVKGIKDLQATSRENTITLFQMDGNNSPYKNSSLLINTRVPIPGQTIIPDREDLTIAEAFPYVFLIRNSAALQPLE
ncbi:hypothetical protein Q0590_30335 [Rhodocytophaga aerolata]|uniref:Erythromycin esterase family protein n=1 Tax=Rhodocytophaga aerolata TaxID=455078 RepID=A0ABT8RFY5_9BACT|nr:hypothetical protein [Rhodocytophaga aerolata]MDO1450611.1 hypothetical protein [Rhodocytophaga aerolata]